MPDDLRPVLARQMEVYAGFLEHTDHHVGRLVDALSELGLLDNTLVYYVIGDNGASAMDTPYQWTKQIASHWGGTRNGTIVHWPDGMQARGEVRSQFHHVIDVAPTVLEAAGLPAPLRVNGADQRPLEGVSMLYSFDDAGAANRHTTQYFEMFCNRGIYREGWTAVTRHSIPWVATEMPAFADDVWELYGPDDWTQAQDIATEAPEKLAELQELFMAEARKYNVLPLDDRRFERFNPDLAGRPQLVRGTSQVLFGSMGRLSENSIVAVKNRSHAITAEVTVPEGGANGVIVSQGGAFGGFVLYVKDGRPAYCYNLFGLHQFKVYVDGLWMDEKPVTAAEFRRFVRETGYVTVAERPLDPEQYPDADPDLLVPGSLVFHATPGPVGLDDYRNWWSYLPGAHWRRPGGKGTTINGRDRHPVVHVAYEDAEAYAAWAGKELPTEAEWEHAARGGLEGAVFAWGDEHFPEGKPMANTWQGEFPWQNLKLDGYGGTSPVGSFPPNGHGLYDMTGNVWEWTSDWYVPRHPDEVASPCCVPSNPRVTSPDQSDNIGQPGEQIPRRVIKGGSHLCAPNYCLRYRPSARQPQTIDTSMAHLGFRCVVREAPS